MLGLLCFCIIWWSIGFVVITMETYRQERWNTPPIGIDSGFIFVLAAIGWPALVVYWLSGIFDKWVDLIRRTAKNRK